MTTQWADWANVIAHDRAVGNRLASMLSGVQGLRPFDKIILDDGSGAARFPLRSTARAAIDEFLSDGPYPILNSMGLSNAQIAADKAAIIIQVGSRADIEYGLSSFLSQNGRTIVAVDV